MTEYRGCFEKVEIKCLKCDTYFWQIADNHLRGSGCPSCAITDSHNKLKSSQGGFIENAREVHGDKYSYEKSEYKLSKTHVTVTCKEHGDFSIRPANLLSGKGCPSCAAYGYRGNRPGSIYVLKSDNIVKIGITNNEVQVRVNQINKSSGKNFEVVYSEHFADGAVPKIIESCMKLYLGTIYQPVSEKFDGYTECFVGADAAFLVRVIKQHAINFLQGIHSD